MITSVVSLRGKKKEWGSSLENAPERVVYIGRRMTLGGWNLPQSPFANPFKTGKDGTSEEVCDKYRKYIAGKDISELKGKILACWCSPNSCHGDVLRELLEGPLPGEVYVGRLPNRQDRRNGNGKWPVRKASDGVVCLNINCSSGSRSIWKNLSPFKVKPRPFYEALWNGKVVKREVTCIENLWQAIKVEDKYMMLDCIPHKEWWARRDKVWSDPKPHRHVIPKKDRVDPEHAYCFWNNNYYSYADARRVVYISFYVDAVVQTEAYKKLADMVRRGHHIQILGPDGRDISSLRQELQDISRPFGHELILAALLRNEKVWLDEKGRLLNHKGQVVPPNKFVE